MPEFIITGYKPNTSEYQEVIYNTDNSSFTINGVSVIPLEGEANNEYKGQIEHGKRNLRKIKVQLGLSCNYECEYCSQRFVPKASETNPEDVKAFVDNMITWFDGGNDGLGRDTFVEYWGGEPLVYWKTLKPLAEAIASKYPNIKHSIVTNGSLLDTEKNEWLIKYGFSIGLSHDGPGQYVRGPDPLDEPEAKSAILALYKALAPLHRFSFNAMVNVKNQSRSDIQTFFINLITENLGKEYLQYLVIGEGGFVDAYDEGGLENSLVDADNDLAFRYKSYIEIRDAKANLFDYVNRKTTDFIRSIATGRKLQSLGQKCGMDKADNIAVDLKGNVLTCQNVSAVSVNPSNISHLAGHVSDLSSVKVNAATHLKDREECPKCPVVHMCKGACMFLTGELWETSCDNSFSDNIAVFANIFELLTGYIPIHIEGPQREDRKDIFWWVNGRPEQLKTPKKVVYIKQI